MTHVVIGAGEVGRAVAEVLRARYPVRLIDFGRHTGTADVMHVCFPYGPDFVAEVNRYRATFNAELVVIHSTVPVGTSRLVDAVHSPVTGRHPNLAESILTFVKFFGGPRAAEAAAIFQACGVRTEWYPDAETTEAGKLLATLQYGWMVAIEKESRAFAASVGADPDAAYARFNEAYNEGYATLGEPYRLPILRHVPGPIGGHCVIPNARLTPSRLARRLLKWNATW